MNHAYCPKARTHGMRTQKMGDELLVYDEANHVATCLNPIVAEVWNRCDGQTPVAKLASALTQFGIPAVEEGVIQILEELSQHNLLENAAERPLVSRRDLIRKLGVNAAMVTAGIHIVALAVPTPAHAGST